MAAAYAALLSLTHIIHDLQTHNAPPISIDPQQLQSLSQIITFLLEFLENSNSPVADGADEADPFEMRIADAAYAVEDVIEFHIVNVINHTRQNSSGAAKISCFFNCFRSSINLESRSIDFYQDLQRMIEEMDLIRQMAVEMNTKKAVAVRTCNASVSVAVPLRSAAASSSSTATVCCNSVFTSLMDKLVGGRQDRQVIPIVGMGGIGKTTLALDIYECKTVKEHFVVCAWVTISQKYNTRELLYELLAQATKKNNEQLGDRIEDELGIELYKYLFGRRFFMVMDDMWSIDVWEKIQQYFPNNGNGSRIMVTTRLWQLSSQLNPNLCHQMEFLDEASSRELFSKTVFGERSCPPELKKIGEEIVENCRGLPLSIIVLGGILQKMAHTRGSWESIRNNFTSIVNLENNKHCLRLLKLSYNHLPVYLKLCFLYMGMFKEDARIRVSTITKLWISEGFLKPMNDRSLEDTVAMEFLKDLVDRNLILIDRIGSTGKIKSCKIHDLLRDLCLKEGAKEGFYFAIGQSKGTKRQCRHIVMPKNMSNIKVVEGLQSMSHVHSVICGNGKVPACPNLQLLRTFHAYRIRTFQDKIYMNSAASQYVNMQHLAVEICSRSSILTSLNLFWNLHTLIVSCQDYNESIMPAEIWKMPQLRHIEFLRSRVCLPDAPPSGKDEDVVIMENLEVIKGVLNFKCSEEVSKRIPNLKKLKTLYQELKRWFSFHDDFYCVSNFQFLSKLVHLNIWCNWISRDAPNLNKLTFPNSLKSMSLAMNIEFEWEEIIDKIGSLPHLEKLKLAHGWFRSGKWEVGSGKWEMVDGQFQELRYLKLVHAHGLKQWIVEDSSVLPRLERLTLFEVDDLEDLPTEIGNITTLQQVEIHDCIEAVVRSAREMVDEQVDVQGDPLPFHVLVRCWFKDKEALQSFSTPNFTVV